MREHSSIDPRVQAAHRQLDDSGRDIEAAAETGNWRRLQQLDLRLRRLLAALRAQPQLERECASQLLALREQHATALRSCQRELAALSQNLAQALRASERHTAYRTVEQWL